ncbi:flagellar filament capping protein FliD [Shewanella surugensis]|uniref:Flagellar hook-associated protein 2 n=1 Tax=Shewanella surugensis TaxID=212020 RepID=A0ABT0LCQ5_9GAMM|nr:flagellar filament capping protein FliD [Shewanella surugensis]MCL1125458.1 flagellar filament capping protein FliD [Shewanella surugensis]
MPITSVGIGSGMDINGIVSALVGAESAPKTAKFDVDEGQYNAHISAVGSLKSALSEFQTALEDLTDSDTFLTQKSSLSKSTYLSASVDETAVSGSYQLKVSQLAESQKIGTASVSDSTAALGEGNINIDVNGESFDIEVAADDSLESVMNKINDSGDNTGVTATIINGDNGPQLIMTSTETGLDNQIVVTGSDTDAGTGISDTFIMTELSAAKDAIMSIDGIEVTSSSNTVENAITGVTFTLKEADVDETTVLTIDPNTSGVKSKVNTFVESYNALMTTISGLSGYNAETEQAGILQGDALPRSLQSQLRGLMSSGYETPSGSLTLASIGVTTTLDGTLEVNDDLLDSALEDGLADISALFSTEDTGLASKMDSFADNYVQAGGILDSRDETLDNQLIRLEDTRAQFALKMAAYESRLFKQYNAMDLIVGNLNAQSSQLQERLDSLPGVVSDN